MYLDLGNGSYSSQNIAFDIVSSKLYSCDVTCWIVSHYSEKCVHSVAKKLKKEFVEKIFLPMPKNNLENTMSEEIEYTADECNVQVDYFEFQEAFTVSDITYTIYEPITFETSAVAIPSCHININGKSVDYYGRGYFEYSELWSRNADYIFIGGTGTRKEQSISPEGMCGVLIWNNNNEFAAVAIDSNEEYTLDADNTCSMMRIE